MRQRTYLISGPSESPHEVLRLLILLSLQVLTPSLPVHLQLGLALLETLLPCQGCLQVLLVPGMARVIIIIIDAFIKRHVSKSIQSRLHNASYYMRLTYTFSIINNLCYNSP